MDENIVNVVNGFNGVNSVKGANSINAPCPPLILEGERITTAKEGA